MDDGGAKQKHETTYMFYEFVLMVFCDFGVLEGPFCGWLNEAPKPPQDQDGHARAILGSQAGPGLDFERFWGTFLPHFGRSVSKFLAKQLILGCSFFKLFIFSFLGRFFGRFCIKVLIPGGVTSI